MERPSRGGGERETDLLVAGRTLALDATAARVAKALGERGIRSLLLKGPSLAQWLYGDGPYRDYVDVDLLVSPEDFVGAGKVLTELGLERFVREAALAYGREPPRRRGLMRATGSRSTCTGRFRAPAQSLASCGGR